MKKLLIVYHSWSNGNTEKIAKMLQKETGGDLLKIDTKTPYAGSYDEVVAQGQEEGKRPFEPEIYPVDINVADYDVIAGEPLRGGTRWHRRFGHFCMSRIFPVRP